MSLSANKYESFRIKSLKNAFSIIEIQKFVGEKRR